MKLTSMKNGLLSFACFLMTRWRNRLPHIEFREVFQRDHRAVVTLDCRPSRDAFPFIQVHDALIHLPVFGVTFRKPRVRVP